MGCQPVGINKIKKAYFIGIKGVGMTALTQVFRARGIKVSGSDTHEKFFTDEVLKKLRIPVYEGFKKSNVPKKVDLIITSAAYYDNKHLSADNKINIEIKEALRRKIPILSYPEALGLLFEEGYGIAVAGTHGKSTVTAMLGVILEEAGFNPTVIVGTRVNQWRANALVSRQQTTDSRQQKHVPLLGTISPPIKDIFSCQLSVVSCQQLLVAEADEYREAFLNYEPKGLIITSIEYDHPDCFKTFRAYKNAFRKLAKKVPEDGFIVANWDDKNIRDVAVYAKCKVIKYGLHEKANTMQRAVVRAMARTIFAPGEHNVSNALAAAFAAQELRVKPAIITKALKNFRGTARRFEIKNPESLTTNHCSRVTIVDDYAHHPSEIKATLKTVRNLWPKKEIWAVFQPHTFSRTEALLRNFAKSFQNADRVFILKTYASAREKPASPAKRGECGKIGAKELAKEIAKYHKNVMCLHSIPSAIKMIRNELKHYSPATNHYSLTIITMGAGDVWQVAKSLTRV